ncbi:LPXTG cell wall anchor domain-containing protein [Pseudactinotalea sp. HY158]|nr:LPXTG cell wall anchor domain-containing protein [Pseudactinotalea sp. HY158]QGH70591.1 LPXTG cell wall anchor domain-containing protein [Pseudactinotalea sp. HY158]
MPRTGSPVPTMAAAPALLALLAGGTLLVRRRLHAL